MIALVLELCCGVCAFSTIAFLGLASVSKLRPDLEEELDVDLEMLLLTEDQLTGHRGADLDLGGLIDGAAGRSISATPRPKKKKMSRLKRPNLLHARKSSTAARPRKKGAYRPPAAWKAGLRARGTRRPPARFCGHPCA